MVEDMKKMLDEYMSAWNSHDTNKIVSFFTDDGVIEDLALGLVSNGKKELTDNNKSAFVDVPDMKFEVKSVFVSGDWAGMEWVMSDTHTNSRLSKIPATGKAFSVRGATVYQFHGGKIRRETDYYNLVTILQQVGLMPAQPKS